MRLSISAGYLLLLLAGTTQAETPALVLNLPAGPLSAAVAKLVDDGAVSVGTSRPGLLARTIPAIHARGSAGSLVRLLASRAGLRAEPLGSGSWIISEAPSVRRTLPSSAATKADVDIVVEASKQGADLRDIPVEVARISGDDLARYGRSPDTASVGERVASFGSTDWGSGHDKIFLRGIADSSFIGSEPSLVGQYWEDQRLTFNGPDPGLRLYDVASVEVLEGPQATLYGAGTLGGIIRVQPNPPSLGSAGGWIAGGLATTAHGAAGWDGEAMLDMPLANDRLGLRILGYGESDGGYIDDNRRNLANVNRTRTRGGRAALRWRIGDGWNIDLAALGQRIDDRDAPYEDAGAPLLTRSSHFAQPSYDQFLSGRIEISGQIGQATLRSTTGITDQSFGQRFEVLQPAYTILYAAADKARLFTHETRLSEKSDSRSWVAGISFLVDTDREARSYGRGEVPPALAAARNRVQEFVAYGEVTQQLLPGLSMTGGGRLSVDRLSDSATDLAHAFPNLSVVPPTKVHVHGREHRFLPSVGLSYRLDARTTLFFRDASSFRPGGLTAGDEVESYRGDRVTSIEAGIRLGVRERDRLALSLTAAAMHWHHVQADLLDGLGLPYVDNIGDGRIDSLGGDLTLRLVSGWHLDLSAILTRNRLRPTPDVAAVGEADCLPNVAHDTVSIALDHVGTLFARPWRAGIRVRHVGRSLFGVGPLLAVPQGDYTTLGAGSTLNIGMFALLIDASNLLDSHRNAFAVGTPLAGLVTRQITPLRPRTLRVGLQYDF